MVHQPNLLKTELEPSSTVTEKNHLSLQGSDLVTENNGNLLFSRENYVTDPNKNYNENHQFVQNEHKIRYLEKRITKLNARNNYTNIALLSNVVRNNDIKKINNSNILIKKRYPNVIGLITQTEAPDLTMPQSNSKDHNNDWKNLSSSRRSNQSSELTVADGDEDDVAVGLVLAVRSLVQLAVTPAVARLSTAMGYTRPMVLGCCCLLASTTGHHPNSHMKYS